MDQPPREAQVAIAYGCAVMLAPVVAKQNGWYWAWLLVLAAGGVAAGYGIGRWYALLLAAVAVTFGTAVGGDLLVTAILAVPASGLGLAAGVAARKSMRLADARAAVRRWPTGAAGLAALLPVAAAGVLWFVVSWFLVRAGVDRHVICRHEPCFGAPSLVRPRTPDQISYGALQAVVAGVGIAAIAALVVRAARSAVAGAPARVGGPVRVGAMAAVAWICATLAGGAIAGPGPAEAARVRYLGGGDTHEAIATLTECRRTLPFALFELGGSREGLGLAAARCSIEPQVARYDLSYRAGHRRLVIHAATTHRTDAGQLTCFAFWLAPRRVGVLRGVTALLPDSGSPDTASLFTRAETIDVEAVDVDPVAALDALRAPGFPPGSKLPDIAGEPDCASQ